MLDKSNMFNNKKYITIIYVVKAVIRKNSASLPQYAEFYNFPGRDFTNSAKECVGAGVNSDNGTA